MSGGSLFAVHGILLPTPSADHSQSQVRESCATCKIHKFHFSAANSKGSKADVGDPVAAANV